MVEVSQCSLCILAFCLFSRHISRTQSFQENRHIRFLALVALKLLVSLISRLVACSARIVVDTHTHTQNDYCNPRCACAPRVNYIGLYIHMHTHTMSCILQTGLMMVKKIVSVTSSATHPNTFGLLPLHLRPEGPTNRHGNKHRKHNQRTTTRNILDQNLTHNSTIWPQRQPRSHKTISYNNISHIRTCIPFTLNLSNYSEKILN